MDIRIKVGIVVVGENGKVLLIREKLEKKSTPLWNVIKGSHDEGETIFETAKRECKEETSMDVELIHALGVYVSEDVGKMRIQFNFLARTKNITPELASKKEQVSRNEAIEEIRWFTKDEILKMSSDLFISARTYELLRDWMSGKAFPLEVYKSVEM